MADDKPQEDIAPLQEEEKEQPVQEEKEQPVQEEKEPVQEDQEEKEKDRPVQEEEEEEQPVQEEEKEKDQPVQEEAGGSGAEKESEPASAPAVDPPPPDPLAASSEGQAVKTKRSKLWSTDPAAGVDLAVEPEAGSIEAQQPVTIGKLFKTTVERAPDAPALKCEVDGQEEAGGWKTITYKEYYDLCVSAAKSFLKLGLEPYHAVAILGFNAVEWFVSHIGTMFAGGVATGIYTTDSPKACHYIAEDCKANVIVVENQKQLDKILQIRDKLPNLKAIVQYKGKLSQEYENVYDWEQFMELGKDMESSEIEQRIAEQKPEQCALLVYTSGTTGNPKGVMLSHDNVTWVVSSFKQHLVTYFEFGVERVVSYLPLCHIAAQIADIFLPMYIGASVYFARPDALKGSLVVTLQAAQPTFFFGVPRVWEKFKEAIQAAGANLSWLKRTMSGWAKEKNLQGYRSILQGEGLPWGWKIANTLTKSVKVRLGLSECKLCLTGAAPIAKEVLEFFMSLNLPIYELFGMSENTGPHVVNIPGHWQLGSCGIAMPGVHTKIDDPDEKGDGEILLGGRHVFMGYLNNEEKTKEAIDEDGWLHTGDIGKLDKNGFLYITGRIKELIITSGGKNIPPVPIEDAIKKELPFLSNVMLIGDKRKYLSCLVTLKCVMNLETGEPTDELLPQAKQAIAALGSKCTTVTEVFEQKDKSVYDGIQKGLDRANEYAESHAQKVQKFTLLPHDLSVPGGELGPTLKLKRFAVTKKYAEEIDSMYAE